MMACDLEGSKIVSTKKISSKNAVSMSIHISTAAAAGECAAERIMRRTARLSGLFDLPDFPELPEAAVSVPALSMACRHQVDRITKMGIEARVSIQEKSFIYRQSTPPIYVSIRHIAKLRAMHSTVSRRVRDLRSARRTEGDIMQTTSQHNGANINIPAMILSEYIQGIRRGL